MLRQVTPDGTELAKLLLRSRYSARCACRSGRGLITRAGAARPVWGWSSPEAWRVAWRDSRLAAGFCFDFLKCAISLLN